MERHGGRMGQNLLVRIGGKNLIKGSVLLGLILPWMPEANAVPLTLRGRDRTSNQACELRVLRVFEEGAGDPSERFRAEVQTSYSHENELPPTFVLSLAEPGVLLGTDPVDGDSLRVTLPLGAPDLRSARAYRLRWLHGDHFHDSVCLSLAQQP